MLDNVADLLLTVSLLALVFEFPTEVALRYMVPGTAVGVLVGDLLFFWLAFRLAKKTGRQNVTAMPLGLDTPSTFGMVFFVLGPAFLAAKAQGMDPHDAAMHTWRIGICAIVISGIFKLACAFGSNWIRRVVPRAGLLGSLAAVAMVLISFLPALEILHFPIVGFVALAIVLVTLVAKIELPFKIPGALGALLVAGTIFYLMRLTDEVAGTHLLHAASSDPIDPASGLMPYEWLTVFRFEWLGSMKAALHYLPIVIPFALATVVGGIDCTESAAAAGDEFDTRQVIGIEAIATLAAGCCGGVIQTTPYIGHPAYKAMGGRAAYTLATALFVGSAGLIGYFGFLYLIIPKAAVFPILIFIGLEITSQSFQATVKRHYPAIVLGCIPALASLVMIFMGDLQGQYAGKVAKLDQDLNRFASANQWPITAEERQRSWEDWNERLELEIEQATEALNESADDDTNSETVDSMRERLGSALQALAATNEPSIDEQREALDAALQWWQSEPDGQARRSAIEDLLDELTWIELYTDFESLEKTSGNPGKGIEASPDGPTGTNLTLLHILSGGFILTSLIWSSFLAMLIDRRLAVAAIYFAVAAGLTAFGVIHSPLPGSAMFVPWSLTGEPRTWMLEFALAYLTVAGLVILLAVWTQRNPGADKAPHDPAPEGSSDDPKPNEAEDPS